MFTKNNHQLQSTAKAEINNDNQNNRKASVFINKLFARVRAFAFVAAVAFSFFAMSADSAQAQQQNNYWANDGCYYGYDYNASQWNRLCPADQSRTKYYFDSMINSQWLRFLYKDFTIYSDNGNTFQSIYVYPLKAWARTYSNGSMYIFAEDARQWMTAGAYREYENLRKERGNPNARSVNPLDTMLWEHKVRMANIWLAPACQNSSHGCH